MHAPSICPWAQVGVFGTKDGKKGVIEYSEIGEGRANARTEAGQLVFNHANIAIYTYSVKFLKVCAGERQPDDCADAQESGSLRFGQVIRDRAGL